VPLPLLEPAKLKPVQAVKDNDECIVEVKYDGFRALAYIENGVARLVSKRKHMYRQFDDLCKELNRLSIPNAVFDGEVVCVDEDGKPRFYDLLRRKGPFVYYVFDVLFWDAQDLRNEPLLDRKARLRTLLPNAPEDRVRYLEHFDGLKINTLFEMVCDMDLEGLVVKPKHGRYGSDWLKLKNRNYTQLAHRGSLFQKKA
jgi:bifunctional non-homologous end joining protein LigD